MNNRIKQAFASGKKVLNVYLTAGYPAINDTVPLVNELAAQGVDMIELGMPFSDPLADGPVIQQSSEIAIQNGMTIELLFSQIKDIRKSNQVPLLVMGYFNQLLKYGVEQFVEKASEVGVDALIIPDLPLDHYQRLYKPIFEKNNLGISFLITPQTSQERIYSLAGESSAFLYMVSSYAITGGDSEIETYQRQYFERIDGMELTVPRLIGFGIKDKSTFEEASKYANGAIIGSAFIRALDGKSDLTNKVKQFVKTIR